MRIRGTVTADPSIEGVELARLQMKAIDTAIRMHSGVQEIGAKVLEEAQRTVAVDTGDLRESGILNKIDDQTVDIYFGTDHAVFVEFGTYKMDAQPFLRPATDKICKAEGFKGTLELYIGKAIGGHPATWKGD
jgi:HK97 gp10 family phage protein